ncbi:MAG: hypothetical protein U0946_00725 [Patescibacteria group bacterium]|nr:hypothetical protein [Patescibacteria group bacterium]
MDQLALNFPGGKIIEENLDLLIPPAPGWKFATGTNTPADIINDLIPIIFVLAGIVLLFMLISGGFTIFVSAGNPEKIKKGSAVVTNAIIGFLIMFASYWIIELLQITFGITVL